MTSIEFEFGAMVRSFSSKFVAAMLNPYRFLLLFCIADRRLRGAALKSSQRAALTW